MTADVEVEEVLVEVVVVVVDEVVVAIVVEDEVPAVLADDEVTGAGDGVVVTDVETSGVDDEATDGTGEEVTAVVAI